MKTAQQAAQNWEQSAPRAAQGYADGVNSYSGDWAGATTAQQTAMLQGVTDAVNSGRWAQAVQAVGTQGWKTRTQAKIPNYSAGFTAGAARQSAAISKIIAAEQNIVPSLPPRGTFQQNIARGNAFATAMHALKGQLGA